jgi:membrane-associated phospholipid phosphatase
VILLAPLHWDGRSWTQAAIAVASVALLSTQDERIDAAVARRRSSGTDSVSTAVTPLGSYAAVGVSVASLGAGLLFKNAELRDTGRDAIEAEIFAAGIITPILKKTVGRLRPSQGSDADEYHPFSNDQSFPSGHSTEAFAVASVFAARSRGWVVPVIAYTLASGVALARINDRAHFASDVVAGAIIGTAVGHTVVRLHAPEGEKPISWNLVPVAARRGVGMGIRLETGGP